MSLLAMWLILCGQPAPVPAQPAATSPRRHRRRMKLEQLRIWRAICGELYCMQQQIRREQQHTPGTGRNV